MTAILLAAGVGKRMGLEAPPKCLLPVGGASLLQRTLEALRAAGIRRVVLVVGYRADEVVAQARAQARGLELTIVENPRYREGAILSLWAARQQFTDDLLIMDADVCCPPLFVERLVCSPHRNGLLVDGSVADTGEEQMVFGQDGRVRLITKRPSRDLTSRMTQFGESVGFLKLSREAASVLRDLLEQRVAQGQVTIEHEQVYPALFEAVAVGYESVDGLPWIEIDTPDDLARAEQEVVPRWAAPRCLNRAISGRCLPWVLKLPLTPNQWTAVSFGLGLASIWCMAEGGYGRGLLGAALFQAFYLVDNWDGEVARAKGLSSRWGGWFDVIVDGIVQVLLPLGLAVGAARSGAPSWALPVGVAAAAGVVLDFVVTGWAKARGFGPGIHGDSARGRGWWRVNATHENFSLLVAAVLVAGWRLPFLVILAVGVHGFWIQYLWRERQRLVGTVLESQNRP